MSQRPCIVIVGRANVGKSSLFNRMLGHRAAVVHDRPGVTRDRVTYKAEWMDRRFTVVDTGGWEPDARGIDASVAAQAEIAIDLAFNRKLDLIAVAVHARAFVARGDTRQIMGRFEPIRAL